MNFSLETITFSQAVFIALGLLWSMAWKGMALWKAARLNDRNWFIALLVINTLGILEIIYIYWSSRAREGISQTSA